MIDPATTIHRNPRATYRALTEGSGGVVLHLDTAQYHGVNSVGAAIWELSADGPSFDQLMQALRQQLDDAPENLADEVEGFLNDLAERNLIELHAPAN
jgi:hypothetical protein